ncbi:hypothetical protein ADIS_3350 [Lunatimonas lonarensis]|uniref:Uncharacterized protein n=1 Tax=Lunatimonas lonarensis TaxID=1232681 RepID=R7ZQ57_9BACT|nr:hypothetical protein ADIS_3350 [Lunatimonas lonarensis]
MAFGETMQPFSKPLKYLHWSVGFLSVIFNRLESGREIC